MSANKSSTESVQRRMRPDAGTHTACAKAAAGDDSTQQRVTRIGSGRASGARVKNRSDSVTVEEGYLPYISLVIKHEHSIAK